jgi:hypothetical protein
MHDLPQQKSDRYHRALEVVLLVLLFFAYAADPPPMVNEAHYLVKAKNYWQPTWCQADMFASSGKAHTVFYVLFGWPTQFVSLATTAWLGRWVGWTILAIGLARLTAAFTTARYASLAVAIVWLAGIEYGNLAGEWVVGGIEAKVPAYGLVLFALAAMVRREWNRVWLLLGGAAALHVLTGGWSVVAAMFAWWGTERNRHDRQRLFSPALFVGGAVALLGLVPAIALSAGGDAGDATLAARIHSYYRLKHHLLPADFYLHWYLRQAALLCVAAVIARRYWSCNDAVRRLGWFTIGTVSIALTGLLIGVLPPLFPDLAAKLLRFYWFRLNDATVPLLAGLMVVMLILETNRAYRTAGYVMTLAATVLITISTIQRLRLAIPPSASNALVGLPPASIPEQQQAYRDWLAVCRWVREATPPDEIFLTPRHQQTFKWYAERAEVVNWKDVPQDAVSLREWQRRFAEIYPSRLGSARVTVRYTTLREFRRRYGVRYMIVDRRLVGPMLPLVQVYPLGDQQNQTYAVYELPRTVR